MLIYLYGKDTYRRQQRLGDLVARYRVKYPTAALKRFTLAVPADARHIREFGQSQSLFGSFKFAVVRTEEEAFTKELADVLKTYREAPDLFVVLVADGKPPKGFSFLLNDPVKAEPFPPLPEEKVRAFIQHEARARGAKLAPGVAGALTQAHGNDLWGIVNDLEVLALGGTLESVDAEADFFDEVGSMLRGSLGALERLLQRGDPAKIFNMSASFARTAHDAARMADYDVAVKSGVMDYEAVLTEVALIAGRGR